jgi:hypothetical protein
MILKKKFTKLKRLFIVLLIVVTAFFGYIEIVNRNSVHMTYRQKVLKAFYPALMWLANLKGTKKESMLNEKKIPGQSFYTLKDTLINGAPFDFASLKGKKICFDKESYSTKPN